MSEASFWNYLRKLLPKGGHYSRIESHDTSAGFPDVHYTLNGNSGTIELKDAKRPGAKHPFKGESGLRRSQITWIRDEIKADGRVTLALQCGDRVYLLNAEPFYDTLHRMTEEEIMSVALVRWRKRGKPFSDYWNTVGELPLHDLLENTL